MDKLFNLNRLKKVSFIFSLALVFSAYVFLAYSSVAITLPQPEQPILFYSNQTLKPLFTTALKEAKKEIFLVSFGLSDLSIISILQDKANANLNMKIFYDLRSSPILNLSNHSAYGITPAGLLHQKIVEIDQERTFIGSANMTLSSLKMHDNLVMGFYSKKLAQFIYNNAPFSQKKFSETIGGQKMELWLLPDSEDRALHRIYHILQSAKKSIKVAMFTFTHMPLAEELIKAHKRGVKVTVILDHTSAEGVSKKVSQLLKNQGIRVFLSQGNKLFHHKFVYIDDKMLINGSTNWTKAAFEKNYECFVLLYDLTKTQNQFMQKLYNMSIKESEEIPNML